MISRDEGFSETTGGVPSRRRRFGADAGTGVPVLARGLGVLAAAWAVLAIVAVVAGGPAAKPADAQAAGTFRCDGTPYIIQDLTPNPDNPSDITPQLTRIDASTSPTSQTTFTFTKIGEEKTFPINALAYRAKDNYLYGARWTRGGVTAQLVRLDSQANVTQLGKPSDLPASSYNHGAIDQRTDTYYLMNTFANTSENTLYKVELGGDADFVDDKVTPVTLKEPVAGLSETRPTAVTTGDFAVSPKDGLLYGVDKDARVVTIDPATGMVDRSAPIPDLPTGPDNPGGTTPLYGGAFFNAQGNLFALRGAGGDNLFQLDVAGGAAAARLMGKTSAPVSAQNDGAACYARDTLSADLAIKLTGSQTVQPGGALEYTAQVLNAGPDNAEKVVVKTNLPGGATFESAGGEGWSCGHAGGVVTCAREAALVLGNAPPIKISATAPAAAGTLRLTSTVSSQTPDPVAANNSATTQTTVPSYGPTAVDDAYRTNEDTALAVPAPGVLLNDTDRNKDNLTVADADAATGGVQPVRGPQNGALILNADGSFTYTPRANFSGTDVFEYRVSDGKGGTDTAIVTINVSPVDDAVLARDDYGSTAAAEAVAKSFISQYAQNPTQLTPTRLYRLNTEREPYVFDKAARDVKSPLNAIGYRESDESLYGYRLNTGRPGIVQVNPATGASVYRGVPKGLPAEGNYLAGDVLPGGSTYYLYSHKSGVLWKVNLSTFKASRVQLSSKVEVADLAVSPADKRLYGVDARGRLLGIDPTTGRVEHENMGGLKAGSYGAAWFTATGNLIAYENGVTSGRGTLNIISAPHQNPVVVGRQAGPATFGNDGAASVARPGWENLSVPVDVLANDENPDGPPLEKSTLSVVQPPQHGVARVNPDATVTYTSGASYRGADSFRYEVCDAAAGTPGRQCAQATVVITSPSSNGPQARRGEAPE